jgi:effector-binding domain-containing protein
MIKKILIVVIGIAAILVVAGFLLPRRVHVERSIPIDRPASLIYATVDSFQLFPQWSPWQELDPHMKQSTEGAREGVGAKLIWSGNDKVGAGSQVITANVPDRSVTSDLEFGSRGVSKSTLLLAPEGTATRVTWTLDMDMGAGPIGRYFGLMMDHMIGGDYDTGLLKLKMLAEGMPNTDISGFIAVPVDLAAVPLAVVSKTTAPEPAAISKGYAEGYGEIAKFMAQHKLRQAGVPVGIDGEMTATSFTFEPGIPIDRGDVTGTDTIQVVQSYAGKALQTVYVGPYDGLAAAYDKFRAFIAAHAYVAAGPSFSRYIDDPGNTPPDQLRTEIYWPIKAP